MCSSSACDWSSDVCSSDLTDNQKCLEIRNGILPLFEPDLEKTLRIGLKKKLTVSNNFSLIKNCDMIFVTVGTPQKPNGAIE